MADKNTHGTRMQDSGPIRDHEDPEDISGDGTPYVVRREYVLEADTAERMKASFRAIIEAPYFAEKAERDKAWQEGRKRWLRSTVGRRLFMPDCNYLMSEVMDAAAFCEWSVAVEPDA